MKMSDAEYAATQQGLLMICRIVRQYDFEAFVERIGIAEALGPIVNPTLYIEGRDNLQSIGDLARAAATFKGAIERVAVVSVAEVKR